MQRARVKGARDTVGAIGAAVDQSLQVHAGEPPIFRHAGAELHQHRVAAAVHVEHLLAREADLHRAAEHQGRLGGDQLVVADVALAAEAAAIGCRDHADLRRGKPQHAGERAVDVVRHLGR